MSFYRILSFAIFCALTPTLHAKRAPGSEFRQAVLQTMNEAYGDSHQLTREEAITLLENFHEMGEGIRSIPLMHALGLITAINLTGSNNITRLLRRTFPDLWIEERELCIAYNRRLKSIARKARGSRSTPAA